MKVVASIALIGAAHGAQLDATKASGVNPVSRVVELLDGLRTQAEKDGKMEEKLVMKFMCWGKNIITTKTASNEAAEKRIKELETYISDIEAGRIEFTSERVDLEKELEEVNTAIEEAKALRKKENEDFLAAEDEMKKTSAALEEAAIVLKEATKGHEEGVLVQVQSEGFAAREAKAAQLTRVTDLGMRVLTKGDAVFLQRLLSGDVPKPDWKKLNRKANFKMAYKARSFKIQDVLAKMKQTVDISLKEATDKEAAAVASFDKLMKAKTGEKEAAEDALLKMEGENGARGATKEESQAEVDALKEQVSNDNRFIEQTQKSLDEKAEEWKDRSTLRAGEISAISKAIFILSNDDAKDLMTRSHKSQGYLLLQLESGKTKRDEAADAIRQAARKTGTSRLSNLANLLSSQGGSHFTEVLAAIDKMVATLKKEEETDLETKETCEKDRDEQTRTAAVKSREMDELTDSITRLTDQIANIKAEIAEKKDTIKATEEELAAATEQRKAENADFKATDADDKLAKETVERATGVLSKFYADNNLMLVQRQKVGHASSQQAPGEAPPPPPPTFDAPYGGKTDEATSIVAILEMITQDIEKDIQHAQAAEDKSQQEFDDFKAKSEQQISDLKSDISELEDSQGKKENTISENTESRTAASNELNAVMKTISDQRPGCDFFEVNYPNRLKNRQIEIDGLNKAKAILQGAEFSGGFLQRRK